VHVESDAQTISMNKHDGCERGKGNVAMKQPKVISKVHP
jgi:hypothetical protein